MHKKLLLLLAFIFVIAACKKDEAPSVLPPPPPVPGQLVYNIAGVHDTSLEQTGSAAIQVAVQYVSGGEEDVTIGVSGLPKNVRAFFNPVVSSKPPYNTVITFEAEKAKAGTYPINIVGSTLTGGIKYYPMTLTILPYSNAAKGLEGGYDEKGNCVQVGGVNNPYTKVYADPQVNERIWLRGIWTGVAAFEVYADMNTGNRSLNIPAQTVGNGLTFEGYGNYTDSTISVNYSINGNLVSDTCYTVFTAN